jgi:hypothetical protein
VGLYIDLTNCNVSYRRAMVAPAPRPAPLSVHGGSGSVSSTLIRCVGGW